MATLKARQKRTNSRCICRPESRLNTSKENLRSQECRYGNCNEWRCVACNGFLGGFGPAACRCDGAPRWLRHRDMAPASVRWHGDVAIKPSLPRRNKRR
jgi:hypothetical protein